MSRRHEPRARGQEEQRVVDVLEDALRGLAQRFPAGAVYFYDVGCPGCGESDADFARLRVWVAGPRGPAAVYALCARCAPGTTRPARAVLLRAEARLLEGWRATRPQG